LKTIRLLLLVSILPASISCGFVSAEEVYIAKTVLSEELTTNRTEGPVFDSDGTFYFCNMAAEGIVFAWNKEKSSNRGTIGVIHPDGSHNVFRILPEGMRGNGMRFHPNGNLLVADQLGGHVLEVDLETKKVDVYYDFPEGSGSPNDLAIRKDGTLYVSFFGDGLWRITPDKEGTKVAEKFHNGIALSPDETRLYSANRIYAVDTDGNLTATKEKLQYPKAEKGRYSFTDGMRTDVEGNIYMARFGGRLNGERQNAVIHMFAPDGSFLRDIDLPGNKATNLAFGGPDGKTVYVTANSIVSFRAEHPGRSYRMFEQDGN